MKIVGIRRAWGEIGRWIALAQSDPVVITSRCKPVVLLAVCQVDDKSRHSQRFCLLMCEGRISNKFTGAAMTSFGRRSLRADDAGDVSCRPSKSANTSVFHRAPSGPRARTTSRAVHFVDNRSKTGGRDDKEEAVTADIRC